MENTSRRGKSEFTPEEIEEISSLIERKLKADAGEQKRIRQKIRDLGFYASEFGVGGGYTVEDFKSVINRSNPKNSLSSLVGKYKEILRRTRLQDELYKWDLLGRFRGRPNPDARNFMDEFTQVNFKNLLYFNALRVAKHILRERPQSYADCLRALFDEGTPLIDRIANFDKSIMTVYREAGGTLGHHHDERTISTLLTYHNPEKYSFFKDSFYQKYCKLLGIPARSKGEKYAHYLDLLDAFKSEYVDTDKELLDAVNALIPKDAFQDTTHTLLAQDILYTVLEKDREIDIEDSRVFKISMGSFSEEELEKCLEKSVVLVHADTKAKGKSDESQAETFRNRMSVGDYFYLTRGNAKGGMKVVGKVTTEAMVESEPFIGETGWLKRGYEIVATSSSQAVYRGPNKWWSPNNNSTCIQIVSEELEEANNAIFEPYFNVRLVGGVPTAPDVEEPTDEFEPNDMSMSLNTILFGPPGTGKTYNSINHALAVIEGKSVKDFENEDREVLKERFDGYVREGRVVFTTFHQSMSYEDFIEGIKPSLDEDKVIYEVEDGIFKNLCMEAAFSIAKNANKGNVARALGFSEAYDEFFNSAEKTLSANDEAGRQGSVYAELPTRSGGKIKLVDVSPQGNLIVQHKNGERKYTISKNRLSRLDQEIGDLDSISNIDSAFRDVIGGSNASAYWAVLKVVRSLQSAKKGSSKSVYDKVDKIAAIKALQKEDFRKVKADRYVVIIDEINRGNISQIFGELITLIEEDKRLGRDEQLSAVLPYSKEKFGVPPNVYLIGTMNTADRSVEALDTALRRRFNFVEMLPQPELIRSHGKVRDDEGRVAGIDLVEILTTVNKRIEKLLDKDHLIGHSYFMDVDGSESLKSAFQNKIIPLLQEYFYGDFGKIGLVLGKGFLDVAGEVNENRSNNFFADFPDYETSELMERRVYRLRDVGEMPDEGFFQALAILLRK